MSTARFGTLEVVTRAPRGKPAFDTPLLFVHGAYAGAWCWDEYFLPYFAEAGFTCHAVSLSGHAGSRHDRHLDSLSIHDYVNDVAEVISELPTTPVLIGHSMGGMVIQKYLERAAAPGAVLLCSVPPQGLMGSMFELLCTRPTLLNDLNRVLNGDEVDPDSLREALFYQHVDDETLRRYYRLCQPESHRAIWDMTLFNLPFTMCMNRPPMLILGAQHDRLITPAQVMMTAATYGEPAEIIPEIGHGVMLEDGWEVVAERVARWLVPRFA